MRIYLVDGRKATFNKDSFKRIMRHDMRHDKKITQAALEQRLADSLGVAVETVHKWNSGSSGGPSDYEMVEKLAKELGLNDPAVLLTYVDEGVDDMAAKLTERQTDAVKRIYDVCVWFLHEFDRTDGFNDYWAYFSDRGSKTQEEDTEELVYKYMDKVYLTLDQEYFDLHSCEIYSDLSSFVDNDLVHTYSGKLGYGYRFEAMVDGNPTTTEDYCKAMNRLNEIVEKYETSFAK